MFRNLLLPFLKAACLDDPFLVYPSSLPPMPKDKLTRSKQEEHVNEILFVALVGDWHSFTDFISPHKNKSMLEGAVATKFESTHSV